MHVFMCGFYVGFFIEKNAKKMAYIFIHLKISIKTYFFKQIYEKKV